MAFKDDAERIAFANKAEERAERYRVKLQLTLLKAKAKGIVVSDKEIDDEIAKRKASIAPAVKKQ
ncbi:MAG: hypothetical protein DDT23_01311 [candidate division WS2 bacterium]|nr:hypothetical protein [Candidatus Lithacetigena glycinireducens]